jgi:uncharacterized protein YggE
MEKTAIRVTGVIGIALILMLTLSAWGDSQSASTDSRVITVSGDAEVRVVPDEVVLTLGIENWSKDLHVAKGQNDQVVADVLALASGYGIDSQHVQTDYVSIEPRYRNGYYEESDFIGYFVRKSVVITLRDLTKFEDLLTDALDAGVNYVQGIQFRTTELREHRDEARALAIQAAEEKANALAEELGQRVGAPRTTQEVQSGWLSGYNAWWGSRWGGAMAQNVIQELDGVALAGEGSLAPGQISVNARVSVTFELQ